MPASSPIAFLLRTPQDVPVLVRTHAWAVTRKWWIQHNIYSPRACCGYMSCVLFQAQVRLLPSSKTHLTVTYTFCFYSMPFTSPRSLPRRHQKCRLCRLRVVVLTFAHRPPSCSPCLLPCPAFSPCSPSSAPPSPDSSVSPLRPHLSYPTAQLASLALFLLSLPRSTLQSRSIHCPAAPFVNVHFPTCACLLNPQYWTCINSFAISRTTLSVSTCGESHIWHNQSITQSQSLVRSLSCARSFSLLLPFSPPRFPPGRQLSFSQRYTNMSTTGLLPPYLTYGCDFMHTFFLKSTLY